MTDTKPGRQCAPRDGAPPLLRFGSGPDYDFGAGKSERPQALLECGDGDEDGPLAAAASITAEEYHPPEILFGPRADAFGASRAEGKSEEKSPDRQQQVSRRSIRRFVCGDAIGPPILS